MVHFGRDVLPEPKRIPLDSSTLDGPFISDGAPTNSKLTHQVGPFSPTAPETSRSSSASAHAMPASPTALSPPFFRWTSPITCRHVGYLNARVADIVPNLHVAAGGAQSTTLATMASSRCAMGHAAPNRTGGQAARRRPVAPCLEQVANPCQADFGIASPGGARRSPLVLNLGQQLT